jgi:plasmid stabilization system protein ParE
VTARRIVLPEAEEEILDAMRWYDERRPGLGLEFLGTVDRAMDRAAKSPLRWPAWPEDERYRRVVLDRFPYLLFYEVRGPTIEFVAVAHAKREPGYWTRRTQTRLGGEAKKGT